MIITLTGPTCAGKSTLEKRLVEAGLWRVISDTTRAPRPNEVDGFHYHFVDKSTFKRNQAQGRYLESARFGNHFYGSRVLEYEYPAGKERSVVVVMEPQGVKLFQAAAKERGWKYQSLFINNPLSVIADRYILRVLEAGREVEEGDEPDPKPYAKRLVTMIEQEQQWVVEARSTGLYDSVIESFDDTNAEAVTKYVVNLTKKEL